MRRLIFIAAATAVVLARPETYRESEDFNYSRSSSDQGTKSGFYAAQRGNMGGNYEKAHNMDTVAQNQMGTAITSVQGELGEAEKVPTGSVYTSGNTRGIYGQGLHSSVLQGRNFNEGANHANPLSHSSLSSINSGYDSLSQAAQQNSRYSGGYAAYNTKNTGYTGYRTSGSLVQAQNNQEALDQISAENSHYGQHNSHGSADTNMEFGGYNAYDQSQFNRHNSQSRYGLESDARLTRTSAIPVRVVLRPGSTVNGPVSAQSNGFVASTHDQNSIVSDAELLSNADNQRISSYKPKSYESSYSYRKQWEKHSDTNADSVPSAAPLAIPTLNPYPKNSELLEDAHGSLTASHGYQGSAVGETNHYARYNSAHESALRSQYDSGYNAQHQIKTASARTNGYNSAAYNHLDSNAELSKLVSAGNVPKQYESSYSYHKSWERQGDPYVIQPVSGGTNAITSQRLRTAKNKHSSHSGYSQNALDSDCDEEGYARVARSVDGGQQTIKLENFGELGQQVQDKWHMEELSQESEDQWHSADLIQEAQQNQLSKLEDFGKQTQTLSQIEKFGQKPQKKWNIAELHQQTQKQSGKLEDFGQHTHDKWDNLQDFTQQSQNIGEFNTQALDGKFNYDKQRSWDMNANTNDKSNGFFQHSKSNSDDFIHQTQGNIDRIEQTQQSSQRIINNLHNQGTHHGQQGSAHERGRSHYNQNTYSVVKPVWESSEENNKDLMPLWGKINNLALQSSTTANSNSSWNMDSQHSYQSWQQPSGSSQSSYNSTNNGRVGDEPWDWPQIEKVNNKTSIGIDVPDFEPGRDDIGADFYKQPRTDKNSTEVFYSNPDNSYHKQNKTPEEIEALNLTGSAHERDRSHYDQHTYSVVKPAWESSEENNKDLMRLWGKINNLALQSSTSANSNSSWNMDSQHSYQSLQQPSGSSQSSYNSTNNRRVGDEPWDWPQIEKVNNKTTIGIVVPDFEPGRGDIGADFYKQSRTDKNSTESHPDNSYHKQNKTPEEIEALSLTRETNSSRSINNKGSQSGRSLSAQQSNTEQVTQQSTNAFGGQHDKTTQSQVTDKRYGYGIEKIDHNSQLSSGSYLATLEQQAQSSWDQNNGLQQALLTQHAQKFDTIGQNKEDFYRERHSSYQNSPRRAHMQSGHSSTESVVAPTVTEITTPKLGFWKSVGTKFVGAKDKVTSWFSSSP